MTRESTKTNISNKLNDLDPTLKVSIHHYNENHSSSNNINSPLWKTNRPFFPTRQSDSVENVENKDTSDTDSNSSSDSNYSEKVKSLEDLE